MLPTRQFAIFVLLASALVTTRGINPQRRRLDDALEVEKHASAFGAVPNAVRLRLYPPP
jgi:hypothetical protein